MGRWGHGLGRVLLPGMGFGCNLAKCWQDLRCATFHLVGLLYDVISHIEPCGQVFQLDLRESPPRVTVVVEVGREEAIAVAADEGWICNDSVPICL